MSIGRREVWAWEIGDVDTLTQMTVKAAWERGYYIITCAECGRPAKQLDNHWPYLQDHNRCEAHMKEGKCQK